MAKLTGYFEIRNEDGINPGNKSKNKEEDADDKNRSLRLSF